MLIVSSETVDFQSSENLFHVKNTGYAPFQNRSRFLYSLRVLFLFSTNWKYIFKSIAS